MILGAVLVGGRSSRFGSDKAAAVWDGAPLADHATAMIAPFVETVVRIGGEHGVADLPRSGLGPLGGVAGALDYARRNGFATVLTIACDMPRLPDRLVEALLVHSPSYCADAPVLGHWPAMLAAELIKYLSFLSSDHRRRGALSIRHWAASIDASPIASPTPLANINTPADLLTL